MQTLAGAEAYGSARRRPAYDSVGAAVRLLVDAATGIIWNGVACTLGIRMSPPVDHYLVNFLWKTLQENSHHCIRYAGID